MKRGYIDYEIKVAQSFNPIYACILLVIARKLDKEDKLKNDLT